MTFASQRGRIEPPNLDDRTWQDLVNEVHVLTKQYAPAWTDHNPSDIGISLIELFAWLVEGLIYRLNQVPDKNYIAFLNLLGITRAPASPATTYLTFTSDRNMDEVLVPAGTQAQTPAMEGEAPVVFETDEDVTVLPLTMSHALLIGPGPGGEATKKYENLSADLIGPPATTHSVSVPPNATVQLCLGFDQPTAREITLRLRLYQPLRQPGQANVSWAYSRGTAKPTEWPRVPGKPDGTDGVKDGTDALLNDGIVRLSLPADWGEQRPSAPPDKPDAPRWGGVEPRDPGATVTDSRFWIGLRIGNTSAEPLSIGIDRALFNSAFARTALTIRVPEEVGRSTGEPFQSFPLRHRPLFKGPDVNAPFDHVAVRVVQDDTAGELWSLVDDFAQGPGKVFRLDPVTGEISFGNYDERSERSKEGHGSVPPPGSRIVAERYRYVGAGANGRVAPGQVTVLGTTPAGQRLQGITHVTNLAAGQGGTEEEPIEDTLRRAPEELKIRDRAVTAEDYEFLARKADIKISRCLTPRLQDADDARTPSHWKKGDPWAFGGIIRAPGTVNVIVVPDHGPSVPRPEPTREELDAVRSHLDRQRDLTAHLQVWGPRYLPITVRTVVTVWKQASEAGANRQEIEDDTRRKIAAFLHPIYGGPGGSGWQVGQPVFTSDLFRAIAPTDDLGYISVLEIKPEIPAYHTEGPFEPWERPFELPVAFGPSARVADYELVCSAEQHKVSSEVQAL
ncbi:putative baseplate assembly protein [Streptomyces sp. NPDC005355]|uniref:putative baseplate assembly protein n=1 Tax=Streptomyces sp. NPDC005355 TaxID=3157038 RepID=UPI0033B4F601